METTIGSRIGELIKALGKTPTAFARSIGKSHTSINIVLEGKSKPGFDFLEALFKAYPKVNADWILKGEGEKFRTEVVQTDRKQDQYLHDYMERLEERFIKMIEARDQQIISLTRMLEQALGKPEVVLAYAAVCTIFFMIFGYKFGYNLLTDAVNWL